MQTNQIYQINDNEEIVKIWNDVKQICKEFDPNGRHLQRPGIDQALRKIIKCKGFYWIWAREWDRIDNPVRPDPTKQQRNVEIWCYKPTNFEQGTVIMDFEVDINQLEFIGRFNNAVLASNRLNISVSNIREVCKGTKNLHKGFFFTYSPINEEDILTANHQDINHRLIVMGNH